MKKTNWQTKKLGEVCDFQNGFAFKSKLFIQNGSPILRISNIQQDKISYNRLVFFNKQSYDIDFEKYKVKRGDLVIAMSGATTGKLAVSNADEIFYLNQRVGKFKPQKSLLKDFLYYYLTTKIEENLKISQGAAQPNLSTEQIKNFQIPLPPLPEQKRIVKILDGVFGDVKKAKENAEKNLANAKELFESYLQSVFENQGKDWEKKELGEICGIARGGSPRPIKSFLTDNKDGVNWIKIGDVSERSKYITKTRQKIKPEGVQRSRMVYPGDFLLSNSMSFGRPYVLKIKGAIHDGWLVLTLNEKVINSDFLYNFLSSKYAFNQLDSMAKGSTVRNLNIDIASKLKILFPKSLTTQKQIVEKLDELSAQTKKLEKIYQQKIDDLEELKKSVLKKAFAGEL